MEALIFAGIQGSGKTTFYQRRFFESHLRISLDMLKTRHRERLLIETCVAAKQRFVVDNTNASRRERARYLEYLRESDFRIEVYFFEPAPERAMAWNARRKGKAVIPVKGLLGTLKRLERPRLDEGFDALRVVTVDERNRFIVHDLG